MSEKVLTGKTALKKVLPVAIVILLIILVSVIFVSVKNSAPNPEISDKDSAYLTIGNYKITKERLYTYLRKNYGVTELAKLVDEKLLADEVSNVTNEDLKEYIIETLYDVDYDPEYVYATDIKDYHEDPKEKWEDLLDTLVVSGKLTKANRTDSEAAISAVRDYYRVDCAREKYAKAYIMEKLDEIGKKSANGLIFSDSEIEDYYEENYGGSSTGIYIPFDSETQALRVMKKFGINTDSSILDDEKGWVSSSYNPADPTSEIEYLTPQEVVTAFIKMYNYMMKYYNNGSDILNAADITTKISYASAVSEALSGLSVELDIKTTSFTLPASAKLVDESGNEKGVIKFTYKLENYTSGDEKTYLTISDTANEEGKYTVTVTRPEDMATSERVYLTATATYQYGTEETEVKTDTKRYTVKVYKTTDDKATISNTSKDVEVKYIIDNIDAIKNYDSKNDNISFNWTYKEINEFDTTLASYLKYDSTKLELSDLYSNFYKSYTLEPIKGTNYYFLCIKLDEKADTELIFEDDEDYADRTAEEIAASDALKAEIVEAMKKDLIEDNDISRVLFENRTKHNLVIYDRYLEAVYQYNYDTFFETTLSVTDYLPFETTKDSDEKVVAVFRVGKKNVKITADELYKALEEKYGVLVSIDFMDDYNILSNVEYNDVYNPYTGKIMDKDAYKSALKSEVASIQKNFEYDYFTNSSLSSYGFIPAFPSDYGWKNFINDYFVAFNDEELLANRNFGGSIYTDAQTKFIKTLYSQVDKVMEKIDELYKEYYSVNVMNLVISLDYDLDASPDTNIVSGKETAYDEKINWTTETKELAKELAELFLALAPQTNSSSLTDQMTALVTEYNKAIPTYDNVTLTQLLEKAKTETIYTYNFFGKYKAAGLKVKWETSATYDNSSSIVEEFSDKLKEIYDEIDKQGLVGETIEAPYFSEVAFETSYGYHMIAVTGTTAPVEIPENAKDIIAKYLYINYTDDEIDALEGEEYDKLAALTEDEQSFIDTWYTPATEDMSDTNPLALALIDLREAAMSEIKFENNDNLERYNSITEILIKKYTEDEE